MPEQTTPDLAQKCGETRPQITGTGIEQERKRYTMGVIYLVIDVVVKYIQREMLKLQKPHCFLFTWHGCEN